jgi:hypothetical protein
VVVRDRRDHALEIHTPEGEPIVVELEAVNRPPGSIISGDFDHDGLTDVILFTPSEPMVMVRSVEGEPEVLDDKTMGQFGLVKSAGPDNTTKLDADGDGSPELLIADENFVRATSFDAERGWRVVDQINIRDDDAELSGLATLATDRGVVIVAADRANDRLVVMARDERGVWDVVDLLRLGGIEARAVYAGSFAGDGEPNVLGVSEDAFALVRFAGTRAALEEFAAYRSDEDDRLEHEIEAGDVNGDGYVDLVVLDAEEQMCQIFTFSASRRLFFATEFEVFESRLFQGGESRSFEPSYAALADLTGDGAQDIMLEVHDRLIIYPQMDTPRR